MTRVRAFLLASVLVNVFLAAALVGGALWVRRATPVIAAGSLRIAGSELPEAERRAFRMAIRNARRSQRPAVAQSRVARRSAADLLRRPQVDQPAILAQLAVARAADTIVRAAVEERAVRFAATLPPGDRERIADAMAARAHVGRR